METTLGTSARMGNPELVLTSCWRLSLDKSEIKNSWVVELGDTVLEIYLQELDQIPKVKI